MHIWRHAALLVLISAALAGCASTRTDTKHWTAEQYYKAGEQALKDSNYTRALNMFEALRGHYPFGQLARQAQLETIYVYYKQNEPKSTVEAAQRFIKENPLSPEVAYAYYMQGLANFNAHTGIMDRLFPVDPSRVDVAPLKESFAAFKTLVEKYPHSRYAPDARRRMIFLRNELAQHQLYVASYYMKRGAYVAVINRCKLVLQDYPGAQATPRALRMMIAAYDKLGMHELAEQTRKVLVLNTPGDHARH
ncbi:outer membrane protein assembly factor BamD [Acidihalobacter prosperus]|uniref:Outer membrane protein assembly factor BamD n=1 Tax=Acidihalobacter prosperus TaxID=160660 RepID=A0A1A6C395_9GAMM|nr:outer membrane protein assembly factor BamD [Acidihalobacter prosperus]OBS09031.1 hypothetical protein Thpro_021359 [Acidihalobacter prosperus]